MHQSITFELMIDQGSNRTNFGVVEQMFKDAYANLKSVGFPGAELTLLDAEGRVLIDYDPSTTGTIDIVRNFEVLMQLNLVEKGVGSAMGAVKGETGFKTVLHESKEIEQVEAMRTFKGP